MGKIAFVDHAGDEPEIYVMNPDGSGRQRLTRNAARDADPSWSPDSGKIAFVNESDDAEIYVMSADGSGQRRLTRSPGLDANPDWRPTPTGKR